MKVFLVSKVSNLVKCQLLPLIITTYNETMSYIIYKRTFTNTWLKNIYDVLNFA